jgi:hypothetical protein
MTGNRSPVAGLRGDAPNDADQIAEEEEDRHDEHAQQSQHAADHDRLEPVLTRPGVSECVLEHGDHRRQPTGRPGRVAGCASRNDDRQTENYCCELVAR